MTRKLVSIVLGLILAGSLLAGCGPKTELIVWSHLTQDEVNKLNEIAQAWAKETGNKVTVVADTSSFQEFATAAKSGKACDIMYGLPHDNLGTFQAAGLLEPVPEGIIDKSQYTEGAISAVSYEGKMWAVPIAMETYALFYRTDKMDKAPATFEDFLKVAQDKGFAYDINNFYFSYAFISAYGGYVFKDVGGKLDPKDIGLANEGAIKGFTLIGDFVNKYKFMPADINSDTAKGLFQNGQTALYISGPWDVKGFKDAQVPFGVAPLPTLEGGAVPHPFMGVQAAFVSSASKHKDEAWQLMKYLVEKSGIALFEVNPRIPARKVDRENEKVKSDPIMAGFAASAANAHPMPNIPEVQAMWTPGGNALTVITKGEQKPADAAKACVEQIKEGIATMGK